MSYNLINQFKKDNKITPKGILFIFMLFVIVVQSAIIIYSNLFELEHHLGFDASSAYLQAVEIWRCKSLVPSTFALTTTLGLDSPTPLAALFYGITGNIFLGFGIANIILDVVIAVIFYNLLKEFKLSAFEIALGFIFLLCPFMTPDHFIDNNLSYFAMVLGEQGSYSVKIITMLLLLWVVVQLEHRNNKALQAGSENVSHNNIKLYISIVFATLFSMLTAISSGIYVAITILVPCVFYYVFKIIYKNSLKVLKDYGFIFTMAQLVLTFACKAISGHIFVFQSKESSMVLTGIYEFWHNIGSLIMGYLQLLCGISIETTTSLFSFRGIIQILSIGFILFILILMVISVKRIIKEIKQKDIDFTEIIPYTIILVNIAIFIFSYTLYDGYFFEYRYLIIVYLMQIVICLKAINKLSDEHIFKALITFAISFVLLCESVGLFRLYHEKTIDSDTLVPLLEEVDTLDVPIAYVWGTTSAQMQIDARNFRIMDLNLVYRTLTDDTYQRSNRWGDYLYYDENSQWTGRTVLITTLDDLTTLPEFIADKYTFVNNYSDYLIYVSEINPFDLTAFDNNCTENINFMYSEGVDIGEAELDSNGYLIADDTVSGNIMNMTLPCVEAGTYSVTINYSSDDNNSDTYFEICNLTDDSVIAKASATAYNETTIDNIEVNDTSDLIIKCFKKDGYSLTLKNVHINRK